MIGRGTGQGLYIGRDIVATVVSTNADGIELLVEAPNGVVVTVGGESAAEHVRAQFEAENAANRPGRSARTVKVKKRESVRVGRGIALVAMGERGGEWVLGIEAPRHVAVSRDDFTMAEHLQFVEEREARKGRR